MTAGRLNVERGVGGEGGDGEEEEGVSYINIHRQVWE